MTTAEIVPLEHAVHPGCLWSEPAYHRRGYDQALPEIWLRPAVAQRLESASRRLRDEEELGLLVWDGWRPIALQRRLWDQYRRELARTTGLRDAALDERAREFVSPPGDDDETPPHVTGGAVDLTLCSLTGDALDMGGEFDELSGRSSPAYYERDDLPPEEAVYRDRRRLLARAMELSGFSRMPTEWWHFEYGTENWAKWTGNAQLFGPVRAPDRSIRRATRQE